MRKRALFVLVLFLSLILCLIAPVEGQDIFITNLNHLCQVSYSGSYSMYMPDTPWCWRGFGFGVPFWLDCSGSDLPCTALFPGNTNIEYNGVSVNVATPTLVRDVITGVTTITAPGSTDIIAQVAAPAGWYPGLWSEDRGVVFLFEQWTNSVDSLESWGEPEGGIIDPTVTLTVLLANAADYDTYSSNVAAAWAAACQSNDDAVVGQGFAMAMDDGNGGIMMDDSGDPCTITNDAAAFYVMGMTATNSSVTTTWQSCTDHVYIVQAETSLTPTSSWADVAWMWGANLATSWIDTNAPSFQTRFYRVVRGNPNTLNNGIPYGWAVTYGLDPLDPNLALGDPMNDGYSNLEKYLQGANPNVYETSPYGSGNVATVRYYYDQDGRLTDIFYGDQGAATDAYSPACNLQQDNSLTK